MEYASIDLHFSHVLIEIVYKTNYESNQMVVERGMGFVTRSSAWTSCLLCFTVIWLCAVSKEIYVSFHQVGYTKYTHTNTRSFICSTQQHSISVACIVSQLQYPRRVFQVNAFVRCFFVPNLHTYADCLLIINCQFRFWRPQNTEYLVMTAKR